MLETDIQHWRRGASVEIRVQWNVDEEAAVLRLDGEEKDRKTLNRRLAGAFKRLHIGHRPGNWRADGAIGKLRLKLGMS